MFISLTAEKDTELCVLHEYSCAVPFWEVEKESRYSRGRGHMMIVMTRGWRRVGDGGEHLGCREGRCDKEEMFRNE